MIQGDQIDHLKKIMAVLDGEETYQEIELLKNTLQEESTNKSIEEGELLSPTHVVGGGLYRHPESGDDINYLYDKTNLKLDLVSHGTPSIKELSSDLSAITTPFYMSAAQVAFTKGLYYVTMQLPEDMKNTPFKSYIARHYPPTSVDNSSDYNRELLFAQQALSSNKNLIQAYLHMRAANTLQQGNDQLKKLLFKMECRLYAERYFSDVLNAKQA